jgi:hypothetical protein
MAVFSCIDAKEPLALARRRLLGTKEIMGLRAGDGEQLACEGNFVILRPGSTDTTFFVGVVDVLSDLTDLTASINAVILLTRITSKRSRYFSTTRASTVEPTGWCVTPSSFGKHPPLGSLVAANDVGNDGCADGDTFPANWKQGSSRTVISISSQQMGHPSSSVPHG